ncbi:MAG: hypothetical protein NT155_04345 [Candidatus Staskawiczbacteria bacterium]|nr:hypothetical protein [Candidatus Staskawiczbacteria bacterium]
MTKKTRLIIVLFCVACFLIIAPILVLHSIGYRFDLEKMKITATGGIYVRTFPAPERVVIDSKILEKPGMFSNSVFTQNLLPDLHTVLIEKNGYYDYVKTLPVKGKEVTKLENVLLFKKNIKFDVVKDTTQSPFNTEEKFIIKNNNLYYSNAPENSAVPASIKSSPVLKKIVAFTIQNNNIIWLSTDGLLHKSDLLNLASTDPVKITLAPIKMSKIGSYKIITDNKDIFVDNNGNLLLLNTKTNNLDIFASPVKNAKISPDSKNIAYFDQKNLYITILGEPVNKNILYKSPETITDFIWLNNYYLIIASANKIAISEIDNRGNVNIIDLPQTITIADDKIDIKNPQIFFNQQEGKLYILIDKTLLSSEKLIP